MPHTASVDSPPKALTWALLPAVLISAAAFFLYARRADVPADEFVAAGVPGWLLLVVALVFAWVFDRRGMTQELFRDLLLIAVGMVIVSTTSVAADISWPNFFRLGTVLALAVAVPYLLSRFVFKERKIRFPWRGERSWTRTQWIYLFVVLAAGYLILPFYFVSSGVYLNWPLVDEPSLIARLFVGVNAVGTWDELFFICTVFAVYRRHFPVWLANILQMTIFVSFLWELGYQSWGPLLTIPFALVQGFTFMITKSLTYVLVVHLLFDLIVFLVIVEARNPGMFPFFITG